MLAQIVGCGLCAKCFKFSWKDSLKVGVGMMTRGEVALIVSQKGLAVGLLDSKYFTSVILLIIVSAVVTPIALKLLFKGKDLYTDYNGIDTSANSADKKETTTV